MKTDTEAKSAEKSWIHRILVLFVLINIFGEIGNITIWNTSSASLGSLKGGFIGDAVIGSAILALIAVAYIISFFGLLEKKKWGALLVIAISIVNRAIAVFLYEFSVAFAFWVIWTIILVALAYLDLRKLSAQPQTPVTAQAQTA